MGEKGEAAEDSRTWDRYVCVVWDRCVCVVWDRYVCVVRDDAWFRSWGLGSRVSDDIGLGC